MAAPAPHGDSSNLPAETRRYFYITPRMSGPSVDLRAQAMEYYTVFKTLRFLESTAEGTLTERGKEAVRNSDRDALTGPLPSRRWVAGLSYQYWDYSEGIEDPTGQHRAVMTSIFRYIADIFLEAGVLPQDGEEVIFISPDEFEEVDPDILMVRALTERWDNGPFEWIAALEKCQKRGETLAGPASLKKLRHDFSSSLKNLCERLRGRFEEVAEMMLPPSSPAAPAAVLVRYPGQDGPIQTSWTPTVEWPPHVSLVSDNDLLLLITAAAEAPQRY